MKFRKKPIVIEAVQWVTDNYPEIYKFVGGDLGAKDDGRTLMIKTLEGVMDVSPFDWIIRGIKGELYPCKNEIFKATYDKAE